MSYTPRIRASIAATRPICHRTTAHITSLDDASPHQATQPPVANGFVQDLLGPARQRHAANAQCAVQGKGVTVPMRMVPFHWLFHDPVRTYGQPLHTKCTRLGVGIIILHVFRLRLARRLGAVGDHVECLPLAVHLLLQIPAAATEDLPGFAINLAPLDFRGRIRDPTRSHRPIRLPQTRTQFQQPPQLRASYCRSMSRCRSPR